MSGTTMRLAKMGEYEPGGYIYGDIPIGERRCVTEDVEFVYYWVTATEGGGGT